MRRALSRWLPVVLGLPLFTCWAPAADLNSTVDFNRDIRPLLSNHCFACHGPDKNKREADLRLDTREGLLGAEGMSGAVTPGRPDDSELVRRVESTDADTRMPPREFGKDLAPAQIELLRRWIAQGASWQGHWSFQPITRPTPPEVADQAQVATPVDRFVLSQLAQRGWSPSVEADRTTLLRRLNFDLTGLPPTPQEADAFATDTSAQAVERVVDRLLASPHFGERMAMWWLDLVRYADSVGYHGDQPVSVFPFRDYVIRSFNENKRFDQFTLEQLAGDLLPNPTLEQRVASGYNRLGMMSAEGGVQPKEYLAKYIAERVRNLGGTWLGLTTGCCECHDHKYDPLTMRDFYSLEAFFADIEERGLYSGAHASGAWGPRVQVPTPAQQAQLTDLDARLARVQQILDTPTPELAAAQEAWEKSLTLWEVVKPLQAMAEGEATLTVREDGAILAAGQNPAHNRYVLEIGSLPRPITALRLEALPADTLPKKGPGRADDGSFVVRSLSARVREQAGGREQPLALSPTDTTPPGAPAWSVLKPEGRTASKSWQLLAPSSWPEQAVVTVELQFDGDPPRSALGHFRLLVTRSPTPVALHEVPPPDVTAVLLTRPEARNDEGRRKVAAYYRTLAPALAGAREERRTLQAQRDALDGQIPTSLVTAAVAPRTIRLLPRGNWMDDSGEIMQPALPAVLRGEWSNTTGRLTRADLAHWLTSPSNPLTARVFVNRVWKLFFGAGLSRKLDDLGAQGDWPTHPALLDWLASDFIDSGWDVKHLVKQIVLSRTYRQSSVASELVEGQDPFNFWLARQSRYRLEAEMVRDNALQVSGLLVRELGGASVKPYQPRGYWAYLNFPQREWENGQGTELYRRGLYTHWQRQYLHPALLAFDAPSREECVADRPRSNTPLQSLVLLNDPTFVEAARVFAERVIAQGGTTDAERATWAMRQAFSRPPEPREVAVLLELYTSHRAEYAADPASADKFLSVGARPRASHLPAAELAAWTSVTRALLGSHEFITRY